MTRRHRMRAAWAAPLLAALMLAPAALARPSTLVAPEQMPEPLNEVRFDQNLGDLLPRDTRFVDQTGQSVTLSRYLDGRPVILAFVYYECPMLCTLILNGLAKSLGVLELRPGTDFDVVAISIDHDETPALAQAALDRTLDRYGKPETEPGWHFLTGSEEDVARVADAAGFRYAYDPETDEYAHSSGIVIVAPDGTINQYYYGIEYPPRDVRLAIVDASEGRAGTLVDQILLYCYRYNAKLGKYTVFTMRLLRFAGAFFVVVLTVFLWFMWRFERDRNRTLARSTVGAA